MFFSSTVCIYTLYKDCTLGCRINQSFSAPRYTDIYGHAAFIPRSIEHAVKVGKRDVISIVQDKHATPADAAQDVREWEHMFGLNISWRRGAAKVKRIHMNTTSRSLQSLSRWVSKRVQRWCPSFTHGTLECRIRLPYHWL